MADWLTALLTIEKGTVFMIGALSLLGCLVLKAQLEDAFIAFGLLPLLMLVSILIFVTLQAAGAIQPIILTDWIKGILVSWTVGNSIGIGLVMLGVAVFTEKAAETETALTRRSAAAKAAQQPKFNNKRKPRSTGG